MSESESVPSPQELLVRFSKLRDYTKSFLAGRVDDNEEAIEELRHRLAELEDTVSQQQTRLDNISGLAEDERSMPSKRALDLQDAMIKAAQQSSAEKGVTWWKEDVKNALATLGHEGLHKPDYYDAMADVAEYQGFAETTKTVTKDGRTWDAKAVRVTLSELPGGDSR